MVAVLSIWLLLVAAQAVITLLAVAAVAASEKDRSMPRPQRIQLLSAEEE
jgi:hypothetical protein